MEAEGSLLWSQKLATCLYPEPHDCSSHIPILFVGLIYLKLFKIISFLEVFTRNPVCISVPSDAFCVPHVCHPPWFNYSNFISLGV